MSKFRDVVGSVRDMVRVVTCSIVIAHRRPDTNWADLAGHRDAPEAHGLISVREDAWPQMTGSADMRAVVSVEADNPDSVRWYADEVPGSGRIIRHGRTWNASSARYHRPGADG